MKKEKIRKISIVFILSCLLTAAQLAGWQVSMRNGTSVHSSSFFQNIGQLGTGQCILVGMIELAFWNVLIWRVFTKLKGNCVKKREDPIPGRRFWIAIGFLLYGIYFVYLIGCYPGFANYDMGNQIPQVLYAEVPYDAHHPILHTLIEGGIISFGYKLYNVDLAFGVFLYCAFQMAVCVTAFSYCIYFVYKYTCKKRIAAAAFSFYAICPPIIMFAMSTTKDVICYSLLLIAVLKIFEIYHDLNYAGIGICRWFQAGGLLTLASLFRKNIIYAVIVFAVIAIVFIRKERKKQILVYGSAIISFFLINEGLIFATGALKGSPMEAFSIPVQQIARVYREEGEAAFGEELPLLYSFVDKEMLSNYDPFISDAMKYAFWLHFDTISENKMDFLRLWIKMGWQYPGDYINAFVDNTYQAWYPGTMLKDTKGYRYFDITDWQDEFGKPKILPLYHFYRNIYFEGSYQKYPVIRLFFSIGFMFWVVLITWFYGFWKKERGILTALGFVLCVALTNLAGPVSDIRYYLLLFYVFPFCMGIYFR